MKFPQRFGIVPAYLANLIHPEIKAPRLNEVLRFLTQPGKGARAGIFIQTVRGMGDYREVRFRERPEVPLYFPSSYRWIDFCQTVDECLNPRNWHNFLSPRFEITANDVVIDCGAAEGLFSWYAGIRGARTIAFEPDEGFVRAMRKTFSAMPNVSIEQCALGHREGTAFLSRDEIFSKISPNGRGAETPVKTLDNIVGSQTVTFIKADVEGYEFRVMLGAESIIRRDCPRIAITMYHPQNNLAEIWDFLRECHHGYQFATKGIYDNGHPVLLQAWV